MDRDTQLFGVTGRPIMHSKSPGMFNTMFAHSQKDAAYVHVMAKDAAQAMFLFSALNMKGMNVTAPFKEKIIPHIHELHDEARILRSVNTVVNKNGVIHGYNTDHYGVTQSFIDANISIAQKKCLVIGAGGAGKAAAYGMQKHRAQVTIVNRTTAKARKAAEAIGCRWDSISRLEELVHTHTIIILALSQHINPVHTDWLHSQHIVFDANYKGSALIPIAQSKQCTIVSAEDWLLNQAVAAYTLFLGEQPDKEIMRKGLQVKQLADKKRIISTIGLMGAGKTSYGKLLAEKLHIAFKDTDEVISEEQDMSISNIFATKGEQYFRELERSELKKSFDSQQQYVLSCGGGIVVNEDNRALLKDNSVVLWLYATPEATIERVNISKRPLLQVDNPLETLQNLMLTRRGMYAHTAHVLVCTEQKLKGHTTNRIIEELQALNNI